MSPPDSNGGSDVTDIATHRKILPKSSGPVSTHPVAATPAAAVVSFNRQELQKILNVYGRKVASGDWRDYAIDFTPNKAIFSIYRRASEVPLFRVEKDPKLAQKQGAYSVIAATGLILKRGHELERVLAVLDRPIKLVYG